MNSLVSFFDGLGLPTLPWIPEEWQKLAWGSIAGLAVIILSVLTVVLVRLLRRSKPQLGEEKKAPLPAVGLEKAPTKEPPFVEEKKGLPLVGKRDLVLQAGLAKTRLGFVSRLTQLFGRKQVDASLLDQLEEILFGADVGTKTAQLLFDRIKERLSREELMQGDKVLKALKEESRKLLEVAAAPVDWSLHQPFVLLIIGVNGAGKTTTIGKLASQFKHQKKHVMLAAGDTFRAAAVEQLSIWGERASVPVVRGKEGADPSSVIFDGIKQAQKEKIDLLIADTAGRLHVKTELMEELRKVRRVIQKADPSAPHETWLVLDATTGQNAIAQATTFKEIMDITGIVLTKLDGTAKGGVILGICNELKIPVRFIGVGEKVDDLRPFDPETFIDALYDQSSESTG